MSTFSPAVDAALAEINALIAGLIEINLPGDTVRLADGASLVRYPDGREFRGEDPVFGSISSIDRLGDGIGDDAPALRLTLIPASDAAAATLASAAMQGSPAYFWLAVLNRTTGLLIGDPDDQLLFKGVLDVPTLKKTKDGRTLEYEITSIFEDFMINDDGVRLNNSFHRTIWPNDNGLEFATSVPRALQWGSNASTDGVDKHALVSTVQRLAEPSRR